MTSAHAVGAVTTHLLRALVSEVAQQPGRSRDSDRGGEQILLDMEVDGVRCILTRQVTAGSPQSQIALSPREREIAQMVARGHPNKVIAAVLEISSWTVSTHLRRIFAKLSVPSRAAMVARLVEDGVLGEDGRRSLGASSLE